MFYISVISKLRRIRPLKTSRLKAPQGNSLELDCLDFSSSGEILSKDNSCYIVALFCHLELFKIQNEALINSFISAGVKSRTESGSRIIFQLKRAQEQSH